MIIIMIMYLDLEKALEHEGDDCTNCDWYIWHSN